MKKAVIFILLVFSAIFSGTAFAQSYEIYNFGEFTGITDVFEYTKGEEYMNLKDLGRLGMKVKDIDGGIAITDGKKRAEIYYDQPLEIDTYEFEEPVILVGDEYYINLYIIGKCFSTKFRGTLNGDVWQIFLEVGAWPKEEIIVPGGFDITGINCDFVNNMMLLQIKNTSSEDFENIKVLVSYYDKSGRLTDTCLRNKYLFEAKEKASIFIPVSDKFDESAAVKVMLWMDGCIPLTNSIKVKNFKFDRSMTVPDDVEQIFADVGKDDRYHDAVYIMNMQDLGWFYGFDDGTYKPKIKVTREEVAYVISCLLGVNSLELNTDYSFRDVPESHWCKTYASFAVSKGYMTAEDGYFNPGGYIDGNDVASIFLNILGEDVSFGDKCLNLALKRNLLKKINTEDLIHNEITEDAFTALCYNFMMEYTKTE